MSKTCQDRDSRLNFMNLRHLRLVKILGVGAFLRSKASERKEAYMPRKKPPPVNLDKYLLGRGKTYISYATGAKMYSMPYWTFVTVAKEAGATWALRKTAIVDMDKLDAYLDKHYLVTDDRSELEKREVIKMPRTRKAVENLEELVGEKKKKYVRYAEGAQLYSMGLHSFENLAKDAGAVRKVKGVVLVNLEKVDAFIESFAEEDF